MTTNEQPAHIAKTTGCDHDGVAVRNRLAPLWHNGIDGQVLVHIADRLDMGRQKYGHTLTVGWQRARIEIYQELLDATSYAIADDDIKLATEIARLASKVLKTIDIDGLLAHVDGAKSSHP